MTTINIARIAVVLLFALTFMMVGWSAPVLYATYAPADEIIEVHDYKAQDTTVNSDTHYTCFDRTVAAGASADFISELYLVSDSGNRTRIDSDETTRYLHQGRETVITQTKLPDGLKEGEYRYVIVINLDMADGRVERTFSFESDTFNITDGPAMNPQRPESC